MPRAPSYPEGAGAAVDGTPVLLLGDSLHCFPPDLGQVRAWGQCQGGYSCGSRGNAGEAMQRALFAQTPAQRPFMTPRAASPPPLLPAAPRHPQGVNSALQDVVALDEVLSAFSTSGKPAAPPALPADAAAAAAAAERASEGPEGVDLVAAAGEYNRRQLPQAAALCNLLPVRHGRGSALLASSRLGARSPPRSRCA
jgi:hypothetical protein